jgi:formylglycine-generating enzyme required for sulfatase activity
MKDDKGASQRVNRGGSWGRDRGHCLAALRGVLTPSNCNDNLGLRLARVPVNAGGK